MPNWCEQNIHITGSKEDIAALRKAIGDDFDFNGLIPCPEPLRTGNVGRTAGNTIVVVNPRSGIFHTDCIYYPKSRLGFDKQWNLKQKGGYTAADAINNGFKPCKHCCCKPRMKRQDWDKPLEEGAALVKKYGFDNWYDWNIANWGTKWNAVDADLDWGDTWVSGYMQTAWSPPEPIVRKIMELFPDITIQCWEYRDEGGGFSGNFATGEEYDYVKCDCGECHFCVEYEDDD